MSEEKNQLVPRLRFEEFSKNDWNKHILDDCVFQIGDGLHGTPDYIKEGNIYFINGNNLQYGRIEITPDTKRISKTEYLKNNKYLDENTILISINGTIGNLAFFDNEKIMLGKSVGFIKLKKGNKFFVNSYLQTPQVRTYFMNSLTGSTIKNLGLKAIRETKIMIPNISEQVKIGHFFETLDEMIQLQQSKVDKIKDIKAAYLSEMFPKEGEKYPKRRFEGFTEPWECHYLCEVTQITMGQSPDSINYTNNPKDFILIQGNSDMKNGRVVPRIWTTQVTKKAVKGDLILSVRAPVGDVGKTDYDVVLGRGVAGLKGNDFIYQTFKNKKERNYWDKLTTGSTFDSINSQDLKNIIIALPSKEEQEKIGEFFKNLDTQITTEVEKLAKLEKLKQAYLNDMFV